MKLIVGLGNPGDKYQGTRHNVGFDVIDALARQEGLQLTDQKFRADYTIWRVDGEKVLLVKPYTFMNLSGEAVLPLMSYYNISPDELVVVYDDLDLEPGKLRLRQSGSAGGHNGVKSIIEMLGTQDFKRVKIGIGRPQYGRKVVDHVLERFDTDDRALIEQKIDQTTDLLTAWAKGETFVQLMNQYN
ncbi:aminoacyl-tRNA hydrolase [uncultured Abiotrophia sp.]|uniref:aminoacyl-tRNA hydrolase n=1 Tax=uncultured Abiotrophia sp. TaxID=316094 RepID=UPI0026382AE6|nr:aminoacyl-tRNA hydrolase [uncultured Abiotrophia sp.]